MTLVQAGAWDRDEIRCFSDQAGRQSHVANKGRETQMRALDSVLNGRPCTYLKMDVEGAEREAIAGARQTIERERPKLNIAAYHRSEDFFELPLLIHSCAKITRFICAIIPMSRRGTPICTRDKKEWKSRCAGCIIKTNTGRAETCPQ